MNTRQARIYAKHETQKRFRPVDLKHGVQVINLLNASILSYQDALKQADYMSANNPGYVFRVKLLPKNEEI